MTVKRRKPISPGTRFGKWTVLGDAGTKHGAALFLCKCDCGFSKEVIAATLRRGDSTQCVQCANESAVKGGIVKHGASGTRTYQSWAHMIDRCLNPQNHAYPRYGARGVKVCDQWLAYENFREDMGERPEGRTLDRYPNNEGGYEPGNCRWATPAEQARNRRPTTQEALAKF